MKKKSISALLLTASLLLGTLTGCGGSASSAASSAPADSAQTQASALEATAAPDTNEAPASVGETAASLDESTAEAAPADYTEANANNDYDGWREMLTTLHTELPITEEPVTLSYFLGYETSGLSYIEGGDLQNQQVWKWLSENTGVQMDLTVVDKANETDKFNLMIASGEYTDLMNISDYPPVPRPP